mgnify:FL=1|jgi:hypothetical protein
MSRDTARKVLEIESEALRWLIPWLDESTRALDLLESRKITSLLVADESGRIEGVLHLHDLWKTEMI